MSNATDARASARGYAHPDPLIIGAEPLPRATTPAGAGIVSNHHAGPAASEPLVTQSPGQEKLTRRAVLGGLALAAPAVGLAAAGITAAGATESEGNEIMKVMDLPETGGAMPAKPESDAKLIALWRQYQKLAAAHPDAVESYRKARQEYDAKVPSLPNGVLPGHHSAAQRPLWTSTGAEAAYDLLNGLDKRINALVRKVLATPAGGPFGMLIKVKAVPTGGGDIYDPLGWNDAHNVGLLWRSLAKDIEQFAGPDAARTLQAGAGRSVDESDEDAALGSVAALCASFTATLEGIEEWGRTRDDCDGAPGWEVLDQVQRELCVATVETSEDAAAVVALVREDCEMIGGGTDGPAMYDHLLESVENFIAGRMV